MIFCLFRFGLFVCLLVRLFVRSFVCLSVFVGVLACLFQRPAIQKALLYRCSFASMLARSGKVDVDARKVERCRMADAGRELEVEPS